MTKKRNVIVFVSLTLIFTWILQLIPIFVNMNVNDTSVSGFDSASVFFKVGGVMPTVFGLIMVFTTYTKEKRRDYFKRCFVPTKTSLLCILGELIFIIAEVTATQLLVRIIFHAGPLGYEGFQWIAKAPYMIFVLLFWGLVSGPFSEEFGWRGYLADQICNRKNMLVSTLFIGIIWGIWHLPLYFYPSQFQYDWFRISPILGLGFIVNCITNALVYSIFYVLSKRRVFNILFLHMFENIIITGRMIYPFSEKYKIAVIPVGIVLDLIFYLVMSHTRSYKHALEKI